MTVTDPAGRWKKYTTDAMGNLVHVTEPNPQNAGQTYETSYVYNDLDQLTRVEMPRPYQSGTATQVRTWSYNALGQLASETQPESGTMSYTYDSVGRLASKTDSRSIREEYSYDLYNRLLQKRTYSGTVEQTQFRVDYVYDTATNGNGRLNTIRYHFSQIVFTTNPSYSEAFEYTAGGLITAKSLTWYDGAGAHSMKGTYTYDNEGRITTEKYPDYWKARSSGTAYDLYTGRTMKYSYDGYGRLSEVNAGSIYSLGWNAAGQLTSLGALSYQYDSIGRLTREQAYGSMDFEYRYLAGVNDGKIWQRKDNISGEEVTYQYDSLGRLSSAQTTSAEWGFSWVYDGFGNRLQQNLTKGTGPSVNLSIDPANNRLLSGATYDAAGNMMTVTAGVAVNTYSYDINHRTTSFGQDTEVLRSATGEKLVQRAVSSPTVLYFHNPSGQLLGAYAIKGTNSIPVLDAATERIYVLGKLVWSGGKTVTQDRLGSIVRDGPDQLRYYPYGEEIGGATAQNRPKFATYNRMDNGIDDAVNRFYNPIWGRFTSPDPLPNSSDSSSPETWNRYRYAGDDPVNTSDPTGLCDVVIGGIRMSSANSGVGFQSFATGKLAVYPYSRGDGSGWSGLVEGIASGVAEVAAQKLGPTSNTFAAVVGLLTAAQDSGPINVTTFSGGAMALTSAVQFLKNTGQSDVVSRLGNITYVSPGAVGPLFDNGQVAVATGEGLVDSLATGSSMWGLLGVTPEIARGCGHDFGCIVAKIPSIRRRSEGGSCTAPASIGQDPFNQAFTGGSRSVFGPFGVLQQLDSSVPPAGERPDVQTRLILGN